MYWVGGFVWTAVEANLWGRVPESEPSTKDGLRILFGTYWGTPAETKNSSR